MVSCTLCHGRGSVIKRETCPTCNGNRTIKRQCTNCGGRAWLETFPLETKCPYCDALGMMTVDCDTCNGTGGVPVEETCPDCQGRGYRDE